MKIREEAAEEQIQWILLYIQKRSVDIWKKNILEDLEAEILEYEIAGKFLADMKKEFSKGDKKMVKIAELKRLEQRGKTIKEFVQEFRRAARRSGYKGRPLVEEFKRGIMSEFKTVDFNYFILFLRTQGQG